MTQHNTRRSFFEMSTHLTGRFSLGVICSYLVVLLGAGVVFADGDYNDSEHPGEAKGYQESSYELSKYETINLANGNLTFRVPLHTLTTDGGLSYGISAVSNLKETTFFPECTDWEDSQCIMQGSVGVAQGLRAFGYTWDLRPPRIVIERPVPGGTYLPNSDLKGVPHWVDESGAVHNLIGKPAWLHVGQEEPCEFSAAEPVCYTTSNARVTALSFDDATTPPEPIDFIVETPDGTVYRVDWRVDFGNTSLSWEFEDWDFLLDVEGWYTTAIERGPWLGSEAQNRIEFTYCTGDLPDYPCPDSGGSDNSWLLSRVTASGESASPRTVSLHYGDDDNPDLCESTPTGEYCLTVLESIDVPAFDSTLGGSDTGAIQSNITFDYAIENIVRTEHTVEGTTQSFAAKAPRLTQITFPEGPLFLFQLKHSTEFNVMFDTVTLPSGAVVEYDQMIDAFRLGVGSPAKWSENPTAPAASKPTNPETAFRCSLWTPNQPDSFRSND